MTGGQELHPSLAREKLRADHLRLADDDSSRPGEQRSEYRRAKVVCVGFLPPPVDGQRLITERMFQRLAAMSTVAWVDLGCFRRFGALSKLLSAFAGCLTLIVRRLTGYSRLYLAPHSGTGLLYSCFIVTASRCLGYRLFVHYHSYKNLTIYSPLMRMFLALCGTDATHIVLAPPMARDLRRLYRSTMKVCVVSNSIFITQHTVRRQFGARPLRVGHVSNLSRDKGVVTVIECMRRLVEQCPEIELVLAGPASDREVEALLSEAICELQGKLTYLGRLSGDDVRQFYESIDVFLFPTLYEHEAEPLVLIEAVSLGVPVIATDRGCIRYLLGPHCGHVLDAEQFVDGAVQQIARWAHNPDELARASHDARARFVELRGESEPQLERLLLVIAKENTR